MVIRARPSLSRVGHPRCATCLQRNGVAILLGITKLLIHWALSGMTRIRNRETRCSLPIQIGDLPTPEVSPVQSK